MVEVKRRQNETTGAMLRRFTRRVQQSGILIQARKIKFYKHKPTRRAMRERALRRGQKMKEIERLKKLGKYKEDER